MWMSKRTPTTLPHDVAIQGVEKTIRSLRIGGKFPTMDGEATAKDTASTADAPCPTRIGAQSGMTQRVENEPLGIPSTETMGDDRGSLIPQVICPQPPNRQTAQADPSLKARSSRFSLACR